MPLLRQQLMLVLCFYRVVLEHLSALPLAHWLISIVNKRTDTYMTLSRAEHENFATVFTVCLVLLKFRGI
jgi:hypothetical protein